MKKLLLIAILLFLSFTPNLSALNGPTPSDLCNSYSYGGLEDGWYDATVKYYNFSTGHRATYALSVKVEYNSVVKIDFGNGGSVHSGYNNSGYTYSGGYLSLQRDYNGNIIAASATVTITDSQSTRSFSIQIN